MLFRMRIVQSNYCFLCADALENHTHLFFLCTFSRKCLVLVSVWFQTLIPGRDILDWWIHCRLKTLMSKKVIAIGLASLMYHIWWSRNQCRIEGFVNTPESIFKKVQEDVRSRISLCTDACKSQKAKDWIQPLLARD
ncbi:hypothetical protein RND81_07G021100 [Saponaria officinalis]|uniref:Reverse transcriptase zinc-binding domain-containing protein n=1 Tax=Saponaria officinalis TaxID=3572 RepID=A0AAW1JK75_SAPOF